MTDQVIPIPADWAKRAFADNAKYIDLYKASVADPAAFWREQGKRNSLRRHESLTGRGWHRS